MENSYDAYARNVAFQMYDGEVQSAAIIDNNYIIHFCGTLNSKDYGTPQDRKRAFVLGVQKRYKAIFPSQLPRPLFDNFKRSFTLRHPTRFQTFPDNYIYTGSTTDQAKKLVMQFKP